ncbi:MAG: VOC family protein [Burkholderiales bacterium]
MRVEPYLFLEGRCDEAIAFYKSALGAEVTMLMRYREAPDPPPPGMLPPGSDDKIMHASLKIGASTVMASDGMCSGKPSMQGFSLSLTVDTEGEAERAFAALSAEGQVTMPLGKTFWSPKFGMCTDKFGVGWMVIVYA